MLRRPALAPPPAVVQLRQAPPPRASLGELVVEAAFLVGLSALVFALCSL